MQEAPSALDNSPSISALELHEILIRSHAGANLGRKRFIDALRALHDSQLYLQLGFPSIAAYSEATFRYGSSRTHEFIQVSRALLALPGITAAFEQGAISFHLAERLSEVATAEPKGSGSPSSRAGACGRCSMSSGKRRRRSATGRDGGALSCRACR